MGNHARDNNAYGAQTRPAAVKQPTAMTKAPTRVPATWGPNGIVASWKEIPAPAEPAAAAAAAPKPNLPSGRDALAHMIALSASNNGRYMPTNNPNGMWGGSGAWMNGGR